VFSSGLMAGPCWQGRGWAWAAPCEQATQIAMARLQEAVRREVAIPHSTSLRRIQSLSVRNPLRSKPCNRFRFYARKMSCRRVSFCRWHKKNKPYEISYCLDPP
jgi:hypothetical protein